MNKVTLLLTLLTITILNGMEMEIDTPHIKPDPVQLVFSTEDLCSIIACTNNYKSLDDVITVSKAMHQTNKFLNKQISTAYAYGDQAKFIELVQALSKRFNKSTEAIAKQFATQTSQEYITAYATLRRSFMCSFLQKPLSLINENVDLNYSSDNPKDLPPLILALRLGAWSSTLPVIESLVKHGADIHYTHPKYGSIINYAMDLYFSEYTCPGQEGRKTIDTILKYLIDTFSGSDEEMRKKLYEKYRDDLLTEEQLKQIEEEIKLDEIYLAQRAQWNAEQRKKTS